MCTFAQRHIWDRQKGQAGIIPAGTGIQCTVVQLLCAFAGGLRIAVLLTQATACAMLDAEKIVVEQAYMKEFTFCCFMRCSGYRKECENFMKTVNELKIGQKATVVSIGGKGALRRRIIDMGITPGAVIIMRKAAPFGDPIEINVRGYELSIRRSEAKEITVQVESAKRRDAGGTDAAIPGKSGKENC